jgi:hypothetical protein
MSSEDDVGQEKVSCGDVTPKAPSMRFTRGDASDGSEMGRLRSALGDTMQQNSALEDRVQELEALTAQFEAQAAQSQLVAIERAKKNHAGISTAYLRLLAGYESTAPLSKRVAELKVFVEANRDTEEAAKRVRAELSGLTASWLQSVDEWAPWFDAYKSSMTAMRSQYGQIASLLPVQIEHMCQVVELTCRCDVLELSLKRTYPSVSLVIKSARHALAHGDAGMIYAAFVTARSTVSMFQDLIRQSSESHDALKRLVDKGMRDDQERVAAEEKVRQASTETPTRSKPMRIRLSSIADLVSFARERVGASSAATTGQAAHGPTGHSAAHEPDDLEMAQFAVPLVNPATGLPMAGPGAAVDIGGNLMGFNNFQDLGGSGGGFGTGFD